MNGSWRLKKTRHRWNCLTKMLDRALQEGNSDYEAKGHKDIALRMPLLHQMPKGGFNECLKQWQTRGSTRCCRLNNSGKYLEDILPFIH